MDLLKNKKLLIFLGLLVVSLVIVDYFKEDSVVNSFFLDKNIFSKENYFDRIQQNDIEVYFCPKENCDEKIINQIDSAKESIDIAIYSFTLNSIFQSILNAQKRGVRVRVIFDYLQSFNAYSLDENLIENGVPIFRKKGVNGFGVMHNKFIIIDNKKVLTGSFNYSINANENNFENLVFINNKNIAELYFVEFNEIWFNAN